MDAGTHLGHFTIVSSLGKGGMGEVWRARDTVLGREVAIKTLPRELAQDHERLARFEREARLLAAVSHPHIAAIYGLEQHADERFLVLELIEGDTLAERLFRGALSVTDSLKLALQIAEALEAAHDKGVIHRDLKPANIKVNREGKIKVLDFGLAKALASSVDGSAQAHAQTLTVQRDATDQGVILGTAAYMAPEQARGEAVDVRADIWAFGCVLFEMLTGRSTFEGRTVTDVLAGVLRAEPEWGRLPPSLHPRIRYLLERCLEKEPRNRYVGIADARVEIEKVLAAPPGALAASAAGSGARRATARWTAATVAATIVAALAVGAFVLTPSRAPDVPVVRFTQRLDVPNTAVLEVPLIDVSRDGTRVAYANGEGILVRDLDDPELRPVQGVGGIPFTPRLSPDGEWLAYGQGPPPYSLQRLRLTGGAPETIVSDLATVPHGLDWAGPNALLYVQPEGIVQVSIEGGEPRVIVPAGAGEAFDSPHVLPGEEALLYTVTTAEGNTRWDAAQVVIQSLGTSERRMVLRGSDARYVASGHLVYAQGSALWAVPFDLRAGEITGTAVQVIDTVSRAPSGTPASDTAQYAISESGTLAYLVAPGSRPQPIARQLAWVKRDGTPERIPVQPKDFTFARVSPDGAYVALVVGDEFESRPSDIWILEIQTQSLRQLTFDLHAEFPFWSRDNSRLYFRSATGGETLLYSIDPEGGSPELIAGAGIPFAVPYEITPDGQTILLGDFSQANNTRIATLGLVDRKFGVLFDDPGFQVLASIAPNGAWIAYAENAQRIVVRSYPDVRRARMQDWAGRAPVFSRDGTEIFYRSGDGIAAAAVQYQPSLRIEAGRTLFGGDYFYGLRGRAWDPHPDGDRFLMIQNAPEVDEVATLHVVVNWLQDLERGARGAPPAR